MNTTHVKSRSGSLFLLHHWSVLLAALLLVFAIGIGGSVLCISTESTAKRVARTHVVRIGYAVEPPLAYSDAEGAVTGESPEVARAVWQQLGVTRIEWIRTDFASLIPQLRAGRFDQIASGFFIRPDRMQLVDMTTPTICLQPALLVRKGNPLHLHSYTDIAHHPEARLALIHGAVEWEEARRAKIPLNRIEIYPNVQLALEALNHNLVDSLSLSAPSIRQLAAENSGMQAATPFKASYSPHGCAAFAFRKSDTKLREQFDQSLRRFLGGPQHMQILRGLGLNASDLPSSFSFALPEVD